MKTIRTNHLQFVSNYSSLGSTNLVRKSAPNWSLTCTVNESQSSFGNLDICTSGDLLHDFDFPTIEAAIENFMAEYLHEDWGWDPFSSSAGVFDNQGTGPM